MALTHDRILTTHTGSLPRPQALRDAAGSDYEAVLRSAVEEVVRLQVEAGVDIVSDGEASKPSYVTYVVDRATGFGEKKSGTSSLSADAPEFTASLEAQDFPDWGEIVAPAFAGMRAALPACIGQVRITETDTVRRDAANLLAAVRAAGAHDSFVTTASPGVIPMFLENQHYATNDAYLEALSSAMRVEYMTLYEAGVTIQLDCPDLALFHVYAPGKGLAEWKRIAAAHVEAINAATADIPPEAMRMHLCWGNYPGPHNHDVSLREILPTVFKARPAAILFEGANPRHEHEWAVFKDLKLPDDKVIIPGVIDSTNNYVEHPELVAQRIVRYAELVGRERVIAGTDCGFETFASANVNVFPTIVYGKLRALSEGAEIATRQLWR